jgi:hypothetical protein
MTALAETSSAYSSFCTKHCPREYEQRMIAATAASQPGKAVLHEKRFKKTREDLEQDIVGDLPNPLIQASTGPGIYPEYIAWETKPRRNSTNDEKYIQSIFERAIAAYSHDPAYKSAEAALWLQYMTMIVSLQVISLMIG